MNAIKVLLSVVSACAPMAMCVRAQNTSTTSENRPLCLLNALTGNGLMLRLPATLYGVNTSNGQIVSNITLERGGPVRSIEDVGLRFILPDYERRLIVMGGPKDKLTHLLSVSMDYPREPWHLAIEDTDGYAFFLVETPPHRLQLGSLIVQKDSTNLLLMPLSGRGAFISAPLANSAFARIGGYFGTVWDNASTLPAYLQDFGKLNFRFRSRMIESGLPNLRTAGAHFHGQNGLVEVKNDAAVVVTLFSDRVYSREGLGSSIHQIYSTSNRTWNDLLVPGSTSKVRSFGKWLAFVVSEAQPWAVPNARGTVDYDPVSQRTSPGKAARTVNLLPTSRGERKVSVDDLFEESLDWFPGILLVYNVDTTQLYRLDTAQGDSEIVLIDGTDVYYRVNASLYHTTIGNVTLQGSTLILTDPIVGNAHFAFLPKASE